MSFKVVHVEASLNMWAMLSDMFDVAGKRSEEQGVIWVWQKRWLRGAIWTAG